MMMVQHGTERGLHQETTYSEPVSLIDAAGTIHSLSLSSMTQPVCERFCSACEEWRPQRGILAVLMGCPVCGQEW